ncbi:cyclic nucleotide-binding domain-containing protein [Pseudodesulfovibrio senegalensis]|jgi:CRP-like cAMP-binding protein/ribosomal protein S25|uniref:Cyclic nucleotide-binding domain-containing protein n=1 Tax=Pseudodesulfovibrio senegalensis TaxID=1721087 RepID=A0A6N6N311_9BACT|nr:cyclic nucleotide-binding domain-containing protein [Pseudodesulfovibrio senegalensis]KAB1441765.1 cyclic nucleotide-binding domain-containing protein [Pseudodesulfovibrio senegalensis]
MTTKQNVRNIKVFYKDQSIFREGQQAGHAYMVKKGTVTLYRTDGNRKVVLDRVGKGEIFGEKGALTGSVRSSSAEAAEYCELMILTEQIIQTLLDRCPKTIQHLTRLLIERLKKQARISNANVCRSTFLSICRILELAWRAHANMPPAQAKRTPNHKQGMRLADLSREIKDILLVSEADIRSAVDQLYRLKLVDCTRTKSAKAFEDMFIRIKDADNFFHVASNLHKELSRNSTPEPELEYVDIFDFAEDVQADPQILYKKIAAGEIPESLFFFHKQGALTWASEQPEDFFKKVKRKRKKLEELEDVNDIVFVDNTTLKQVFSQIGYYKLGVLMTLADEDARKKIDANLAKKIARIVREEAENRATVEDAEAEDVQDELIELIRTVKGGKAS